MTTEAQLIQKLSDISDLVQGTFSFKRIGRARYWEVNLIVPDLGLNITNQNFSLKTALEYIKDAYYKFLKINTINSNV